MQISFREWEDSPLTHRAAASLGSDEVQVWIATVPSDEAGLTAVAREVSPDERARAERFRVSEPRPQFVFGRALLRQLLGACLTVDAVQLAFGAHPRGQ